MTTIIEDVTAVLAALAPAGKVWYSINTNEPATLPYIVWNRVASQTLNDLHGPTNQQNTRVQIDIFAQQISQAVSIQAAVVAAMLAAPFTNIQLSSMDSFEAPIRAHRITLHYSVWATN